MKNLPDQRADDILFTELFGAWGDQTAMARLEGISPTNFRRQLDPDNPDHPSDLHRAKRLLFAAYVHDESKGERVWAELRATRDAAVSRHGADSSRSTSEVTRVLSNFICLTVAREEGQATDAEVDAARLEAMEALAGFQAGRPTADPVQGGKVTELRMGAR